MSVKLSDGVPMRVLCAFVLAAILLVLASTLGGDKAAAIFSCGMVDGKFSCQATQGGPIHGKNASPVDAAEPDEGTQSGATSGSPQEATIPPASGNTTANVGQGAPAQEAARPGEHSCPPGYTVLAVPGKYGYCQPPGGSQAAAAPYSGCQHGMVGTPPSCHCPKNSELLGGNCVHYTTTACQTELPANVNPEPCQAADEKLACKPRQDGLKDCCCLTYDKL
jgi:hypothetical protein